jgi:hypothetical protein
MFMDEKTYRICLTNALEGRFEVDAMIAKTIQILNKKGYVTEYSCGGHAKKDDYVEVYYLDGTVVPDAYVIDYYNEIYISFKKGTNLPSLPDGFHLESSENHESIYCYIDCDEDKKNLDNIDGKRERLKIFKKLLRKNYELFMWARSLPNLRKNNEIKSSHI